MHYSNQVKRFLNKHHWTELRLSQELDISPETLSRRLSIGGWLFDEISAIRKLFKRYNLVLVGEVKQKVKIKWQEQNK